jgi:peptide/nickel transport system permease protein
MATYIIRRVLQAIIVIFLVTIIVFFSMRLLPGDPILMLMTQDQLQNMTMEQVNILRHENGLDRPMIVQYFDWMGGLFTGDLGKSILLREPVSKEIFRRLPTTLYLGLLSMLLSIVIGIPAGVISAVRRGKWVDNVVTLLANIGITVPVFWLGIILIWFIGLKLELLPIHGYTSPFDDFWKSARQVIMPVICLALFGLASNARQARSSILEVMGQDYIRTAWSKGLRERMVIIRHALKNGLIPIVTLLGMGFSFIIGGSVLIETVFNIPGIGRLTVNSVQGHDYPFVQAIILIIALVVVVCNLAVDLSYGWLDPRIRYE